MTKHTFTTALFFLLAAGLNLHAALLNVPADIDHAAWDRLLQKHVNKLGLVNYKAWHESKSDKADLQNYLKQFEAKSTKVATGGEQVASLINAYNAFTIQWILENYPTPSIRKTKRPWKEARWTIGGEKVSLDDIEHKNLRPLIGWKVHSVVVCAARSCPPLLNKAYTSDNYEAFIEDTYKTWLGRVDLNSYDPDKKVVRISKIFDWYGGDYKGEHAIKKVLARYAPERYKAFLSKGKFKVKFANYDWDLNEQAN